MLYYLHIIKGLKEVKEYMNASQYVNTICKHDSEMVDYLIETFSSELKKKNKAIINAKFTNTLTVFVTDIKMTKGYLILNFETANPEEGYIGHIEGVYKVKVPSNLVVQLPKVLLLLLTDLETLEFLVPYKKWFFFVKNVVCRIKVKDSLITRVNKLNIQYNTGFSGSVQEEAQKIDIQYFGKRDGVTVKELYEKTKNIPIKLGIDIERDYTISPMNTIQLQISQKEFHIMYSAIIFKDEKDYQIIYDSMDGSETKKESLNYIKEKFDEDTFNILEAIIQYIK